MIDYVDVPIFKASVLCFIDEDADSVKSTLDGEANQGVLPVELCDDFVKEVRLLDDSGGFCNPGVHGNMLLYLSKWNEDYLVHEVGHLAFQLLSRLGIPHTQDTDEVFSYVSEFLFSHIKEMWLSYSKQGE